MATTTTARIANLESRIAVLERQTATIKEEVLHAVTSSAQSIELMAAEVKERNRLMSSILEKLEYLANDDNEPRPTKKPKRSLKLVKGGKG